MQVIREVLEEELEKDPKVILIGEDIGKYGGAFGVTKGLHEKYSNRIFDMPMSEQSIIGLGIGAAINGLRPIVEIMFMDFMTLAYDQLFNHASIFSNLTDGSQEVPLVIRVPGGGGKGYGATHSKMLAAPLAHIPGIKIVAPSCPKDAGGLLKSALKERCPVIFIEHKLLYSEKEEIGSMEDIPLGKANTVKQGKDVLVITFSKMVKDCLAVAQKLENENISAEVLDLRTIKPLDVDSIKRGVEKIGKVLIVEEGYPECGIASEVISKINESCFYSLDGPIKRICTKEVPIPCSLRLESEVIPSQKLIENEIRSICNE